MGGQEIDENSAVLGSDSKPTQQKKLLEVCTTTTDWRDNSLLDQVVFGRVARGACARYVLDDSTKAISLVALAGGRSVEGSKSDSAILVGDLEVCPSTLGTSPTMCRVA